MKKTFIVLGFGIVLSLIFLYYQKYAVTPDKKSVVQPMDQAGIVSEAKISDQFVLPLSGSAPTQRVKHSIALTDIRQGCFRQDCIPSVDAPTYVSPDKLRGVLDPNSIGIALTYKDEQQYYPFPMLETHELVNATVGGDPLLISYCPLCGTGIVFSREVAGVVYEFGVSGMLWNSNLLMYNRADQLSDRNLWSQVLGEAVVGGKTGTSLTVIPSDIMTFAQWREQYPDGQVLSTGTPQDPYNQQYFAVARQFAPNFDETTSVLAPDAYVYGIEVEEKVIAVTEAVVAAAPSTRIFDGVSVTVERSASGQVSFIAEGVVLPDIEGFWFSLKAAYPDVIVWDNSNN